MNSKPMENSQSNQYYPSAPPQIVVANIYGQVPVQSGYPGAINNTIAVQIPAQNAAMPPRYPGAVPDPITAESCFTRGQKNKPQTNTLAAVSFIFLSGGLNIAFSIGYSTYRFNDVDMRTSWFIAAIIGCVLGAFITPKMPKKFIVMFCSLLVLIEGILFLVYYNQYRGLIAARYLNGIGVGMAYAAAFALVGENTVPERRGIMAASIESAMFSGGILLQVIYCSTYQGYYSLTAETYHGIFSTIFGGAAVIWSFFIIESPVYHLVRGQEQQAIASVIRLQRPTMLTFSKCDRIDEHKRYIAMNKEMSFQEGMTRGLPSLLKLSMLRGLLAMSFTSITLVTFSIGILPKTNAYWVDICGAALLFFSASCSGFAIDAVGRKPFLWFGTLLAAGSCLGLGIIFSDLLNLFYKADRNSIIALTMLALFGSGFTYSAVSAYTAEAFPLAIKPYFSSLTFIVQMLVHIIISTCTLGLYSFKRFYFASFALLLVSFVASIWLLPESKRMTLREAQSRFQKWIAK